MQRAWERAWERERKKGNKCNICLTTMWDHNDSEANDQLTCSFSVNEDWLLSTPCSVVSRTIDIVILPRRINNMFPVENKSFVKRKKCNNYHLQSLVVVDMSSLHKQVQPHIIRMSSIQVLSSCVLYFTKCAINLCFEIFCRHRNR